MTISYGVGWGPSDRLTQAGLARCLETVVRWLLMVERGTGKRAMLLSKATATRWPVLLVGTGPHICRQCSVSRAVRRRVVFSAGANRPGRIGAEGPAGLTAAAGSDRRAGCSGGGFSPGVRGCLQAAALRRQAGGPGRTRGPGRGPAFSIRSHILHGIYALRLTQWGGNDDRTTVSACSTAAD